MSSLRCDVCGMLMNQEVRGSGSRKNTGASIRGRSSETFHLLLRYEVACQGYEVVARRNHVRFGVSLWVLMAVTPLLAHGSVARVSQDECGYTIALVS